MSIVNKNPKSGNIDILVLVFGQFTFRSSTTETKDKHEFYIYSTSSIQTSLLTIKKSYLGFDINLIGSN